MKHVFLIIYMIMFFLSPYDRYFSNSEFDDYANSINAPYFVIVDHVCYCGVKSDEGNSWYIGAGNGEKIARLPNSEIMAPVSRITYYNKNLFFIAGNFIYNYDLFKHELKELIQTQSTIIQIVPQEDYLYFNTIDGKISRVHYKTLKVEEIIDKQAAPYFYILDDNLYYGSISEQTKGLYVRSLENFSEKKLSDESASFVYLYDGYIYYIASTDAFPLAGNLRRITPEGSIETVISGVVRNYNIKDEWIYYVDGRDNCMYKVKLNGAGEEKISSAPARDILIYGQSVYSYANSNTTWKYDLDTHQLTNVVIPAAF